MDSRLIATVSIGSGVWHFILQTGSGTTPRQAGGQTQLSRFSLHFLRMNKTDPRCIWRTDKGYEDNKNLHNEYISFIVSCSAYCNLESLHVIPIISSIITVAGAVPSVLQGVVTTTACINQDRECCVGELDISVRNCSSFVVYKLKPTPACTGGAMGYCVGEGVPCPSGLASSNGYTPCDCKWIIWMFVIFLL